MNLHDLTLGDYRVSRALTYPDHPLSLIVFDARVEAKSAIDWVTDIAITGTYTGPTDVVACDDYRLAWIADAARLLESGDASLECRSGDHLRQAWTSIITPGEAMRKSSSRIQSFPPGGQTVEATISRFAIDGERMSYEWEGTVAKRASPENL